MEVSAFYSNEGAACAFLIFLLAPAVQKVLAHHRSFKYLHPVSTVAFQKNQNFCLHTNAEILQVSPRLTGF